LKKPSLIVGLVLGLLIFILSACGPKPTPTASSPDQAYTQIWETVASGQTKTAAAATPVPAVTDTPQVSVTPKATKTPLVSSTPSGDATSASTSAPAATNTKVRATAQASCDNFQFIDDVTYPDGSEVAPGATIVKTWKIKNLGPCEWNEEYMLTYGWGGEGTEWNTAAPTHFSKVVKVGETIEVSIELVVPDEAGSYGGIFRVRNADDVYFGTTLTIYIVVK
jgi:hypothetical protein